MMVPTGNSSGQSWKFIPQSDGTYKMSCKWKGKGKVIDVINDGNNNNYNANNGYYNNGYNQVYNNNYNYNNGYNNDDKYVDSNAYNNNNNGTIMPFPNGSIIIGPMLSASG